MLWVSGFPISETESIIRENLKTGVGKISLLAGVVYETEPGVVDEFNGFEGIGCCEVLGKVITIPYSPESVEFGDASYVGG